MKKALLFLCIFLSTLVSAQQPFRTKIFQPAIKTLQVLNPDDNLALPFMELNNGKLSFSFDELSHNVHSYSYRILHCNANWLSSNIPNSEYLSGFTSGNITNYEFSVNTTQVYTHYAFELPNVDVGFKTSGNYVVQIIEDNNVDEPVAQVCFYIVDPKVAVEGKIRGNTDTELNGRLQQLDFDILLNGYIVRDPMSEMIINVQQNERIDNQVSDLKPTYILSNKLSYVNNNKLIFEGGNEFHRFDISNVYGGGVGVDYIRFQSPLHHAYIYPDRIQNSLYAQNLDVNGKYVVNVQNASDINVEADYMKVHLMLPLADPFFDGQLYVGGGLCNNIMDDTNRMIYNASTAAYELSLYLKQGGYSYQYWFVPKASGKVTLQRVDGSFWQTENDYTVFVYHRAFGERYDRLVGLKLISN